MNQKMTQKMTGKFGIKTMDEWMNFIITCGVSIILVYFIPKYMIRNIEYQANLRYSRALNQRVWIGPPRDYRLGWEAQMEGRAIRTDYADNLYPRNVLPYDIEYPMHLNNREPITMDKVDWQRDGF